jgi:hypothetical protein
MLRATVKLNTVKLNTVKLNTVKLNTVKLNTVKLNTVKLNTVKRTGPVLVLFATLFTSQLVEAQQAIESVTQEQPIYEVKLRAIPTEPSLPKLTYEKSSVSTEKVWAKFANGTKKQIEAYKVDSRGTPDLAHPEIFAAGQERYVETTLQSSWVFKQDGEIIDCWLGAPREDLEQLYEYQLVLTMDGYSQGKDKTTNYFGMVEGTLSHLDGTIVKRVKWSAGRAQPTPVKISGGGMRRADETMLVKSETMLLDRDDLISTGLFRLDNARFSSLINGEEFVYLNGETQSYALNIGDVRKQPYSAKKTNPQYTAQYFWDTHSTEPNVVFNLRLVPQTTPGVKSLVEGGHVAYDQRTSVQWMVSKWSDSLDAEFLPNESTALDVPSIWPSKKHLAADKRLARSISYRQSDIQYRLLTYLKCNANEDLIDEGEPGYMSDYVDFLGHSVTDFIGQDGNSKARVTWGLPKAEREKSLAILEDGYRNAAPIYRVPFGELRFDDEFVVDPNSGARVATGEFNLGQLLLFLGHAVVVEETGLSFLRFGERRLLGTSEPFRMAEDDAKAGYINFATELTEYDGQTLDLARLSKNDSFSTGEFGNGKRFLTATKVKPGWIGEHVEVFPGWVAEDDSEAEFSVELHAELAPEPQSYEKRDIGPHQFTRNLVFEYLRSADERPHGVIEIWTSDSALANERVLHWKHTRAKTGAVHQDKITFHTSDEWQVVKVHDDFFEIELDIREIRKKGFANVSMKLADSGSPKTDKLESGNYLLVPDRHNPIQWYYAPELAFAEFKGRPRLTLLQYHRQEGDQLESAASLSFQLRLPTDVANVQRQLAKKLLYDSTSISRLVQGVESTSVRPGDPFSLAKLNEFPMTGLETIRAMGSSGFQHPLLITPLPISESRIQLTIGGKSVECVSVRDNVPAGTFRAELTVSQAKELERQWKLEGGTGIPCTVNYVVDTEFQAEGDAYMPDPFLLVDNWLEVNSDRTSLSDREQKLVRVLEGEYRWALEQSYRAHFEESRKWKIYQSLLGKAARDDGGSTPVSQLAMLELATNYLLMIKSSDRRTAAGGVDRPRTGNPSLDRLFGGTRRGDSDMEVRCRHYEIMDQHAARRPHYLSFLANYPHVRVKPHDRSAIGPRLVEFIPLEFDSKGTKPEHKDGFLDQVAKDRSIAMFERNADALGRVLAGRRTVTQKGTLTLDGYSSEALQHSFMPSLEPGGDGDKVTPAAVSLPAVDAEEQKGLVIDRLSIRPMIEFENRTAPQRNLARTILNTWKLGSPGDAEPIGKPDDTKPGVVTITYPSVQWRKGYGWFWQKNNDTFLPMDRGWLEFSLDGMKVGRNELLQGNWLNARLKFQHFLHHSTDAQTTTQINGVEAKGIPLIYVADMRAFQGSRELPYPSELVELVRIDLSELVWKAHSPQDSKLTQVNIRIQQGNRLFETVVQPAYDDQGNAQAATGFLQWPFLKAGGEVIPNIMLVRSGDIADKESKERGRPWLLNDNPTEFESQDYLRGGIVVLEMDESDWKD